MATVQWTIVAYFLFGEMAAVFLLCLPIPAHLLKTVLETTIVAELKRIGKYVFYAVVTILLVLFGDAVRGAWQHSTPEEHVTGMSLDNELSRFKDLFRAERNCYIAGFALFLMLVMHRLVGLICKKASLEDEMVWREKLKIQ